MITTQIDTAPAMAALGWLLASDELPEVKIQNAIASLRVYGFDETKPLAKSVVGTSLFTGNQVVILDPKGLLS